MDAVTFRAIRQKATLFLLGFATATAIFLWVRVPLQLAAGETLAILEDNNEYMVISFPNRTMVNGTLPYRIRFPKHSYPAYSAMATIWHHRAHQPAPPLDDAWVTSLPDY